MRKILARLIESLFPFEIEKKTNDEIIDNTIELLKKLPFLIRISIHIYCLILNFLTFKNMKSFYFCKLKDRKHIINTFLISKLFNFNILRILRTFSWMCFYDNPRIQEQVGYKIELN